MDITGSILFRIGFLRAMLPVMTHTDAAAFGILCLKAEQNMMKMEDVDKLEELYQKFEKRT